MSELTLDEGMMAVLSGLKKLTIVRDKGGKVVGRFYPGEVTEDEMYDYVLSLFDLEEMKRRKVEESGKGRPLSEILARLDGMEKPS